MYLMTTPNDGGEQWRNREEDGGIVGNEGNFQHGRLAGFSDGSAKVSIAIRVLKSATIANQIEEK